MNSDLEPVREVADEDTCCEMTSQRMLGVALLGALGSVALYYIYASLAPETRRNLRESVASSLKANLNKLAG